MGMEGMGFTPENNDDEEVLLENLIKDFRELEIIDEEDRTPEQQRRMGEIFDKIEKLDSEDK